MQVNYHKLSSALILLLSFFQFSCKKFVDVKLPPNLLSSETLFTDEKTADAAVAGIYSQVQILNLSMCNGGLSLYPGLSADEFYTTSTTATAAAFSTNSLLPDNGTVTTNFWAISYKCIYQANLILENLGASPGLSNSVKQRLSGEVKCLRAFFYFYLVNLFGDVPLVTTSDYRVNAVMPRTPVIAVYQLIKNDLEEAKVLLQANGAVLNKGRVNKFMATALLARVYLFTQEWGKAEVLATELIASSSFILATNLNSIFPGSSSEVIWQLIRDNANTAEGTAFIPSSSTRIPAYALRDELLNSFENGDLRKTAWVNSNFISGTRYYYPYKYKVRTSSTVTEYNCILRLAEQYLIRAEARAEQNKINEGLADLNIIRNRAGLANIVAATKDELINLIIKERRIELFAEWGHRWFDLKRKGMADAVLGPVKGNSWSAEDQLYPIPETSIESNPFLIQNPGY